MKQYQVVILSNRIYNEHERKNTLCGLHRHNEIIFSDKLVILYKIYFLVTTMQSFMTYIINFTSSFLLKICTLEIKSWMLTG